MSEGANERRYVRVKCYTPVYFTYHDREYEGTLRDVSLCGAFVLTGVSVKIGEKVRLRGALPIDGRNELSLRGRIVRKVTPPGNMRDHPEIREHKGFGVDFAALPLRTRTLIDDYVRHMFRAFRSLQFELSRADFDPRHIDNLVRQTYLRESKYGTETLKDIVAVELKQFRLRPL